MKDCINCLYPCEECKDTLEQELDDPECDCGKCVECKDYQEKLQYFN